jgi:ABC-2 type transport system ATP-binding protein
MAIAPQTDTLIDIQNASISFPKASSARTLRQIMAAPLRQPLISSDTMSLSNVTLTLRKGDRLGLIGSNGAGKSTLLRLLAGVYLPSGGSIAIHYPPACLFDLNVGFDLEASGMVNIPIAAAQLGYPRTQLSNLIDFVEKFTELGSSLNLPIRAMSSGMQMRLAFAISIFRDSPIYLIDEIVGVGDARFVAKAQEELKRRTEKGCLVLASHAEYMLRDFCNKGLVLEKGRIKFIGDLEQAISVYNEDSNHAKQT